MSKVDTSALHNFATGELVTEAMMDQNFEVLRVAGNDTDDKLTAHKVSTDHDSRYYTEAEVDNRISSAIIGNPLPNTVSGTVLQDGTVALTKLPAGSVVAANGSVPMTGQLTANAGGAFANAAGGRQLYVGPGWGDFSSSSAGDALIGNNCYLHQTDSTFRYAQTHASLGARGIFIDWIGAGISKAYWFDMGNIATVAGQTFSPTLYEVWHGGNFDPNLALEEGLVIESALPVTGAEPAQMQTAIGPAIEFANAVTQSVTFNRRWPFAGNLKMEVVAATDTSFAGNFRLQVGWQVNGGAATNVGVTVTTLASTLSLVTVDLGQIIATANVPVGSTVTFVVSRLGADALDTHTGKFRLYHTRLRRS